VLGRVRSLADALGDSTGASASSLYPGSSARSTVKSWKPQFGHSQRCRFRGPMRGGHRNESARARLLTRHQTQTRAVHAVNWLAVRGRVHRLSPSRLPPGMGYRIGKPLGPIPMPNDRRYRVGGWLGLKPAMR
jgi:hypothetical protein